MATQPDPWPNFLKDYKQLKDLVRRLVNRDPLAGTGMSTPSRGTTQVDGSLVVQGGEAKSGNFEHGSAGWHLGSDGSAEFKDVTLYDLPNSMLASPVAPAVAHADAANFSLTSGANQTLATATVPVPSGYTRALVSATAGISAFNPTASPDYLFCVAYIQNDTARGWSLPVTVNSTDSGCANHTATALLTGLSGSFTVRVAGSTQSGTWNTEVTGNVANIDATVLFLR
jgi:hypothetical protein